MSELPIAYRPRVPPSAHPVRASSTALLHRAFPDGLDEPTYRALVELLRVEGHLSFRAVAETLAAAYEVDYLVVYNAVLGVPDPDVQPPDGHRRAVRATLVRCGWEAWLREDPDRRPEELLPPLPPHPDYAERGRRPPPAPA